MITHTHVKIPVNLGEALVELDHLIDDAGRHEVMALSSSKDMSQYHHIFGMWLRNNWGLWSGSVLAEYFNSIGIQHPDDMSGIILTSYWRWKHNQPFDLDEQVDMYKQFWINAANNVV